MSVTPVREAFQILARDGLLEGGGTLNWSALESGIVQQVQEMCIRDRSKVMTSMTNLVTPS